MSPEFAALVKQARERKKITQEQLAQLSGLSQATISRLESGKLRGAGSIRPDDLAKLCAVLEINGASQDHLSSETLRVGAGFCTWAAPVLKNIIQEGGIKGAKITTFGIGDSDQAIFPHWYALESGEMLVPSQSRESQLHHLGGHNKFIYADPGKKVKYYHAKDLLDMLKDDELDCAVIPGDLYENDENKRYLTRVARIMHTVKGACMLTVVTKLPFSIPARGIWNKLLKESDAQVLAFFPMGTIADKSYRKYVNRTLKQRIEEIPLDIGDYDKLRGILHDLKGLMHQEERAVAIFLSWEPHTSVIARFLHEQYADDGYEIQTMDFYQTKIEEDPILVSFDIFLSASRLDKWCRHPSMNSFLLEVERSVLQINQYQRSGDVDFIARYMTDILGMTLRDCTRALESIHFEFMYYPEWIDAMRNA